MPRKVIIIRADLYSERTFNRPIIVPFPVDTMIVRQIAYSSQDDEGGPDPESGMHMITSSLVEDPLGTFIAQSIVTPQTQFDMHGRALNSNFQFRVIDLDTEDESLLNGMISIVLEFVGR